MKKATLSSLLFTAALFFSAPAEAQKLADPGARITASGEVTGALCDSIKTTYAGGDGNNGIMFNIVANQALTVTFIDCIFSGTSGWVYVYHRTGSYIGYETTPGAWSLADSVQMSNPPAGVPVRIPAYIGFQLNAGDTGALYISGDGNLEVDYTVGTAQNTVYTQDFYMQVLEGRGMGVLWNTGSAPKVFNGNIYYCPPATMPCQPTSTLYASNTNNDGAMFDIVADYDVTIDYFFANISGSGYIKIYYRNGPYAGYESNPGAWTLLDSALVTSAGTDIPTLIPVTANVTILAGQTAAFYMTGNQTGAGVNCTNGTTEGAVYCFDGVISILEGKGVSWPFSGFVSPRQWNGTVVYCMENTVGLSEPASATIPVSVYPNPFSTTTTFMLEAQPQADLLELLIFDATGRVLRRVSNISAPAFTVDREGLSPGMYFYTLTGDGQPLSAGKLIVE